MLLLLKQVEKLPLGEARGKCEARMRRLRGRGEEWKGEAAMRVSRCLVRVCEEMGAGAGAEGFALLEHLKGLTMEVHEANRVEVYLVKIRSYLLAVRWSRLQGLPLDKVLARASLFLEQLKATPLHEAIASDFYSHLERLYLELVQEKVRRNSLGEAVRLIGVCFEAFKAQLSALSALFDPAQKKLHLLLERKLELLALLFRYEHGVRVAAGPLEPDQVTAQILPKYERIAQKVTADFPPGALVSECEAAWISGPNPKHNSVSLRAQSVSLGERASSGPFNEQAKLKHRESLQETAQYLEDFFKRRANSTGEASFDRSAIRLPASLHPSASESGKKSYFRKEKLEHLNERAFPSEESESVKGVKEASLPRRKGAKSRQIIEPKKFKLVLQMDRLARERMIQMDPFASMKQEQAALLGQKRADELVLCV